MSKPTIKDIARLANVSPAAVSYVINNRSGVSIETRRKIQDIIKSMNFQPNLNSQKLIFRKSFNICVVNSGLATYDDPYYSSAVMSMVKECEKSNYNIIMSSVGSCFDTSRLKRSIDQNDVDGVIFIQNIDPDIAGRLNDDGMPFVVMDFHRTEPNIPCVYCDYRNATRAAVSWLIDKGHRKIAYIGMGVLPDFHTATQKGFFDIMNQYNLTYQPDWLQSDAYDEASVYQSMKNILSSGRLPSAVFCATDFIAVTAMKCIHDAGLNVPADISVCGMDNMILSKYCTPRLTTVDIDNSAMGIFSVKLLMKLINRQEYENILIPADTVIERESVRRL